MVDSTVVPTVMVARASSLAEDLLSGYNIEHAPVPVDQIAEGEGVRVTYVDMISDGSLAYQKTGPIIRVNKRNSTQRQRFTIAHELGHLFLERQDSRFGYNCLANEFANPHFSERLCNTFASHLLVPENDVIWQADWVSFAIEDILPMAHSYQVSLAALLWRVLEIAPGNGGAIWITKQRGGDGDFEDSLLVDWAIFPQNLSFRYRKNQLIAPKPQFDEAFRSGKELVSPKFDLAVGNFVGKRPVRMKLIRTDLLLVVMPKELSYPNAST